MIRILLDTNAYSAFKRGDAVVVEQIARADEILFPVPVLAGLRVGFKAGSKEKYNLDELEAGEYTNHGGTNCVVLRTSVFNPETEGNSDSTQRRLDCSLCTRSRCHSDQLRCPLSEHRQLAHQPGLTLHLSQARGRREWPAVNRRSAAGGRTCRKVAENRPSPRRGIAFARQASPLPS